MNFILHPFKALKQFMPTTFFGRALLILVTPLVLVQVVSAYVFFDRHWDSVTKTIANDIAGEVATTLSLFETYPQDEHFIRSLAQTHMGLRTTYKPFEKVTTPIPEGWQDSFLHTALEKQIFVPFTFDIAHKEILIQTQTKNGVLEFATSRKRLYSKTTLVFVLWAGGTSVVFLFGAILYMRNQIKPLRRLALAADRFGKGRSIPLLKPEGAVEIRKLTQAFLTMRQRLDKQMRQRTDMLAGISHDLRTPLTRMRLQLAMMPQDTNSEGLIKDLGDMEKMLDGYLSFARGEESEALQKNVDLNHLVHDIIERAEKAGKPIHENALSSTPLLTLKPQSIKRCINNLIQNALHYGTEVWVTLNHDQASVTITIEDNGPGIAPEKIKKVFRPFFRVDASRNADTGGVGLGLTIARDIAHSHGGDVYLSASSYGGLKAQIILPL